MCIRVERVLVDVYRWLSRASDDHDLRERVRDGVLRYVVNSLVALRELGRPDLARDVLREAVLAGFWFPLLRPDAFRQVARLMWEQREIGS